jgi:hypothetical protein
VAGSALGREGHFARYEETIAQFCFSDLLLLLLLEVVSARNICLSGIFGDIGAGRRQLSRSTLYFHFDCMECDFGGYFVLRDLEFEASFQTIENSIKNVTTWPNITQDPNQF